MLSDKLAPEIRSLLEAMAAQGGPAMETLSAAEARQAAHGLDQLAGEAESVSRIETRKIPSRSGELPVRIYVPEGSGPFPGVVFLHGGGWVICDLDTHDNICRAIARRAGSVVVSVDYRLAPEHPFPAALEDSFDAACWVADNAAVLGIDPGRMVIAGDSAGANMATVIAAKARGAKRPVFALQVLVYPATDLTSFDYAKRMQDDGVPVTLERYDGMIHPFLNFLGVTRSADKALDQIAGAIRKINCSTGAQERT